MASVPLDQLKRDGLPERSRTPADREPPFRLISAGAVPDFQCTAGAEGRGIADGEDALAARAGHGAADVGVAGDVCCAAGLRVEAGGVGVGGEVERDGVVEAGGLVECAGAVEADGFGRGGEGVGGEVEGIRGAGAACGEVEREGGESDRGCGVIVIDGDCG